jgi:hypothetical protein
VGDSAREEVEKEEGLTIDRFVASDGWWSTSGPPAAPELSHSGGGFGRGRGGEGRGPHHRPVCGLRRVVEHRWAAGRRRPGGLAAERLGPGCSGLGAGRGGAGKFGVLVELLDGTGLGDTS